MFGLQILDLMIGMVFIYVLLALVCAAVTELIAGWRDSRMKNLSRGIHNLLGEVPISIKQRVNMLYDKDLRAGLENNSVQKFYNHPLVKTLYEDGTKPSYIPSKTFARVIVDMFSPATGTGSRTVQDFAKGVKDNPDAQPELKQNLLILVDESGNDIEKLMAGLEGWFNNSMDRISAWYKNKSQGMLLFLALCFSIFMNADSIQIAKNLYNDGALRSALVAQAQAYAKENVSLAQQSGDTATGQDKKEEMDKQIQRIQNLGLKIGWDKETYDSLMRSSVNEWLFKLIGWLITAIAVSLGAPFWFDMLNKLVSIRAVGKSPNEKSAKTDSGSSATATN